MPHVCTYYFKAVKFICSFSDTNLFYGFLPLSNDRNCEILKYQNKNHGIKCH